MSHTGGRGFNNSSQKASSNSHYEKKDLDAEEKLTMYWSQLVTACDYFDVSAAQLKLEIKKLHYLPFFRDTQKLNEIISTVVSCYKHQCGIHSYWDLNKIVLSHVNKFQQRGPSAANGTNAQQPYHRTFEEVGIGSLASQRDVANLFKFSIPCDPRGIIKINAKDVMDAAFECLSLPRFRKGDNKDEKDFNDALKQKLANYYECSVAAIGLNVQYRIFFFANKSTRDQIGTHFRSELNACEKECRKTKIAEYSESLANSMSIIRTGPYVESSSLFMRKISDYLSIDLNAAHEALKVLLTKAGPDNSFRRLFWELQNSQGKTIAIRQMPTNGSDEVHLVSTCSDVTVLIENMQIAKEEYIMCEEKQDGTLASLAVAFICYLSLLMPKGGATKKERKKLDVSSASAVASETQSGVSEEISRILKENCMDDVPDFAINTLEHFIADIVSSCDFDPVKSSTLKSKLNFISLQKAVSNELDVQWKKGGYTVKKNTQIGVLTASIIMHRVLIAESSIIETEGKESPQVVLSRILNTTAVTTLLETECRVSEADPVSIVAKVLSNLEVDVMTAFKVPAVSCLLKGTFLHQLLSEHPMLLKGLSEAMVRESKWGSSEVGRQLEVRIADDDVAINLASCMKELAEHLTSTRISNDRESFLASLLELELAVVKRIGSFSFLGATGKSLPEFIAYLVQLRDNYDESHPMAGILADFGIAYDSLLASFPALNSDSSEMSPLQLEAPGCEADYSTLPDSISLQCALGVYLLEDSESSDGLQEFLASSLGVFLSEKECVLLLERHSSSGSLETSTIVSYIPPAAKNHWTRPVPLPADARSTILQRLRAVPYGFSCVTWCLWNSFESAFEGSLLDFIITEASVISDLRPNVRYIARGNGPKADCIPVPYGITDSSVVEDAMEICFKSKDYCGLGAWCIAAELGHIDTALFKGAIERSMIAELSNHHGLDNLVRFSVETATSVPSTSLPSVFLTLLDVLARVSETDLKYLQRKVFESYYYHGMPNASRDTMLSLVGGLCHKEECNDLVTFILNVTDAELLSGQNHSSKSVKTSSLHSAHNATAIRVTESSLADATAVVPMSSERSRSEPASGELIDNCRLFVQNLLKSDFNYDANGCKMEDRPVDIKLNKTIENLSNQLYSTEVHFLSEVIQNADDNDYSDGVTPSLLVALSNTEIVFDINEKGFTEKDIKSVCSVSESTKEGKKGFIGQKGIGFKSVFAISDYPEIHSNGFHIQFNRESSMIEPIFIDDAKKHLPSSFPGSGGTVLRLPFDSDAEKNIDATNVKVHLAFNGKLLLYLNKLSSMELHDKQKDRWVRHMRRTIAEQLTGTWISLTTEERSYGGAIVKQESYWYRKTIEFEPRVKRGKYSVDSTKVSIAVCFQVKETANSISVEPDGTETLSVEKGENEGVKCRQLVFDSNQPTYPIYAFLPTKIVIFRFVLQGDFILPSNRESCKEDSPWNKRLLEMVPDLFVDLILDVAGSVRLGEQSAIGDVSLPADERCLQSPTPEHRIALTSDNLKSLLPRKSLNTAVPMYVELISNMYVKLSREPFLRCSSGSSWPSSQLVSTQHLSFDPTSFISEDTLFACTGKRYINSSEMALDDELMTQLRIVPFSTDIISSCVEALAKTASISLPSLAGLLLALEKLSAPSMATIASLPAVKQSLLLVPSQTFGKMKSSSTSNSHSKASLTEEKREVIRKVKKTCMMLRSLPFWPISTGLSAAKEAGNDLRVALDAQVVFIYGKITPRIRRCFERIPSHRVMFLDDKLLETAETMVKDGRVVMRSFLLSNFASSAKSSGDWGKSVREVSGGLEELSPKGLVHNVIMPLYSSLAQQCDGAEKESESKGASTVSELNRVSASACLAIIYLSDMIVDDTLRKSAFLPTVTARVKKSSILHWSPSPSLRPSKLAVCRELSVLAGDVHEVHFGLEFPESSICRLEKQHIKTALMQLSFCIVDPLIGALALDVSEAAVQTFLGEDILHSAAVSAFRDAKIKDQELKKFQDFLRNFGCVDLFGVYSATGTDDVVTLSTPFLLEILQKMTQHGDVVSTDKGAESRLTEHSATSHRPTLSSYVSAYVPHPALQVLDVSVDAHRSLIELFNLVEREVTAMKLSPTSPPSWFLALLQMPWCPCGNTELAKDRSNHNLSVQYLVTSPLNILPHSHCHVGLAIHPDIKSTGLLVKDPAPSGRDFTHHSSVLSWMSRQDRVLASVSIMSGMYKFLCSMTTADASSLKVIRGLLQGGKNFLWISDYVPDSKPRSSTSLEWGALVPLSSVVLSDLSGMLPPLGPVKALYPHYDPDEVKLLFSRNLKGYGVERICYVCQAKDGMFGSRGLPWPESTRGHHVCECKDTGFGRFVPEMQGLVRITPSLDDFISVLKYHRERLRGASAAETDLQPVMSVLEIISTNVWKSFYIKKSLHPYSPEALSALKETLLSCDLLPTMSASGEPTGLFVSATGATTDREEEEDDDDDDDDDDTYDETRVAVEGYMNNRRSDILRVISVDDLSLFRKLQEHLTGKVRTGKIRWIYTGHAGGVSDSTELDFDSVNCDLQLLENDVKDTLNLTPSEFLRAATTIAPETFLAPKSTATLFHFLGVTTLSSLFVTEASTAPPEAARVSLKAAVSEDWSPATLALSSMNSLLEIAQRILFTQGRSDLFQLAQRGRLKSLLLLQPQDSTYLVRVVRLKPGQLPAEYEGFEMSQSMPFQRHKNPEEPLLINKSCSEAEVVTMCIDLIMHALRIEVALYDQNQKLDLMSEIASKMDRFAQNPHERFRFDYLNIQELPVLCDPWKMKTSSVSKPAVNIEEEGEDVPESPIEGITLKAVKPDQTVLKFIEESKARAMLQRQGAMEARAVSAEEASVINNNEMRRDILSDHLAAIMLDCPTTPNLAGPVLPDPAMEVLRYQGVVHPRSAESTEVESSHRTQGDRAPVGPLSVESHRPPNPTEGGESGSGSGTNGPMSSSQNTSSGGLGPPGNVFQGVPPTPAHTHPDLELDFHHALPEELFQNQSLAQMGGFGRAEDVRAEDVPRVMLSNNAFSGRIGESLAFEYLRLKASELGFVQAEWMNANQESGLPFDIRIRTSDGTVKFCEVKTRSFRDTGDRAREHCQWFISLKEVDAAIKLNADFFALCLSISVNVDEGRVTPHSANFIGLERGFVQALDSKGASLILQDNRARLPLLTLIQDNRVQLPPLTLIV